MSGGNECCQRGNLAWLNGFVGFVEKSNVLSLKLESQWEPGVVWF